MQQFLILAHYYNGLLSQRKFKKEVDMISSFKQDMLELTKKHKVDVGYAHDPRKLVIGIGNFFNLLSSAKTTAFNKAVNFIIKTKNACCEATLDGAILKMISP